MSRPEFDEITSGDEFHRWYWLKTELVDICKRLGLPHTGRKFELRDRIIYALDHGGALKPEPQKRRADSRFNWAKEQLTLDTVITDNVSFGPNFRTFMKQHIGKHFSCNRDFMDWVRSNIGNTLRQAVEAYHHLEKRRDAPGFETEIADSNMFNQYTRDFMKDNPNESLHRLRRCWLLKKNMPTRDGFVRYEKSDLELEELQGL